jgi:hypothetical protein
MERSLTYVSCRSQVTSDPEREDDEIITTAHSRNATLNVTGALICTSAYFVQVLEGPAAAVGELMVSIERDNRHRDVSIVEDTMILSRQFAHWTMAYRGSSTYVARQIQALLDASPGEIDRINSLRSLIADFAMSDTAADG